MITGKQIVAGVNEKVKETARNIVNDKSAKAAITDAKIKGMKPVSKLGVIGEPVYQASSKIGKILKGISGTLAK